MDDKILLDSHIREWPMDEDSTYLEKETYKKCIVMLGQAQYKNVSWQQFGMSFTSYEYGLAQQYSIMYF